MLSHSAYSHLCSFFTVRTKVEQAMEQHLRLEISTVQSGLAHLYFLCVLMYLLYHKNRMEKALHPREPTLRIELNYPFLQGTDAPSAEGSCQRPQALTVLQVYHRGGCRVYSTAPSEDQKGQSAFRPISIRPIISNALSESPPNVSRFAEEGVLPARYPTRFHVYRGTFSGIALETSICS